MRGQYCKWRINSQHNILLRFIHIFWSIFFYLITEGCDGRTEKHNSFYNINYYYYYYYLLCSSRLQNWTLYLNVVPDNCFAFIYLNIQEIFIVLVLVSFWSATKSKTPPYETFYTHLPVQSMGLHYPCPLLIENWVWKTLYSRCLISK